ncbi:MAG: ferritin family protein [Promethearchaeota archaeon]
MFTEKQLSKFLKEQVQLEKRIIRAAKASVKNAKNKLVRYLIEGIALDSSKHALLLNALIAHVKSQTPFISQEKRDELGENISKHIELEAQAIETYRDILPKTTDPTVKQILQSILEDERRHHQLLQQIFHLVIEKETLTEEDLWDLTWKDVPFHGAPGG